jgi:hypothetical protein
MGTEIFLTSLNLPARCELGNTIFKKQFYENARLNAADKKLITNNVEKVVWQYCLKPDTINIQPYQGEEHEYLEVQVIEVRLKAKARHQRIAKIIMRAIPYPMILQLTYGTGLMVVAGMPRINLADHEKHTIEEFVYSPWVDSQNLSAQDQDFLKNIQAAKLSFTNFYRFYDDFVSQLHLYNAAKLVGKTLQDKDPQEAKQQHAEIMKIERELVSLRAQLKKASMFNRKVELNVKIKHFQVEHRRIKGLLQGEEVKGESETS